MEEVKKIVRSLTKGKFIEKMIQCMEICGHKWMFENGDYRVPTKKEVKGFIEYIVEKMIEDPCYNEPGQSVRYKGGFDLIWEWSSEEYSGRHWKITYTGLSQELILLSKREEKNEDI